MRRLSILAVLTLLIAATVFGFLGLEGAEHRSAKRLGTGALLDVPISTGRVSAQEMPPIAPAEERLLFAPVMGVQNGHDSDFMQIDLADRYTGLRVQNTGDRSTRVLLVYESLGPRLEEDPDDRWRPRQADEVACDQCNVAAAMCSAPIDPGTVWSFPASPGEDISWINAGTIYSLNTRPAADYGEDWERWLDSNDLQPDASLADVICDRIAVTAGWPDGQRATLEEAGAGEYSVMDDDRAPIGPLQEGVDCLRIRELHRAFLDGSALTWLGGEATFAAARGEPIAAVAAPRMPSEYLDQGVPASVDRYEAIRWEDLQTSHDQVEPGEVITRSYAVPGVYTRTPEGRNSVVWIMNAGTECATLRFEGHGTGSGQLNPSQTMVLPAGGARLIALDQFWSTPDPITLRVSSNQPLAVVGTNFGYATSASWPALSEHWGLTSWALPRAFQEPKPIPGGGAELFVARRVGLGGPADAAKGRETNISVFNSSAAEQAQVKIDTQAEGKPLRSVTVLIDPLVQNVYQLGFGLGDDGGPGWARFTPVEDLEGLVQAVLPAFESFRMATDVPAASEVWAAPAWPVDLMTEDQAEDAEVRGAGAIALPDLAGPALGPASGIELPLASPLNITQTMQITDSLTTRIAIQNLDRREARVAVDVYGGACGFLGSAEHAIESRQTLTLRVGDLPGAAYGPNAAMVRVLAGQVAALVETAREEPMAIDAQPDLSTAYLGIPLRRAVPPPSLEPALLTVAPERIELPEPSQPVSRSLAIGDELESGRCLSYAAETDSDWLRVEPARGVFPSQARLWIDPEHFGEGDGPLVGVVTIRALESSVLSSPRTVRVVVDRGGGDAVPTIHLPLLLRGGRIDR